MGFSLKSIKTICDKFLFLFVYRLAKRLKCDDYVECSAKTLEGVHDVFNSAVRAVLTPNKKGPTRLCSLL